MYIPILTLLQAFQISMTKNTPQITLELQKKFPAEIRNESPDYQLDVVCEEQRRRHEGWQRGGRGVQRGSVHSPTVVSQHLALLTQVLGVHFALIGHVQTIRLFQWSLFVGVDHDVALDALLSHVGPAVAAHPLSLALGALVLPKAPFFALVRC